MKTYLYFTLVPEALIASMLPPEKFGTYRAVGVEEATHGPEIFFQIEGLTSSNSSLPVDDIERLCVPHSDGSPKKSAYIAIYRVLELLPLETIKTMYLVTRDGRVLAIDPVSELPKFDTKFYLYQQMWPAHPQIVSTLNPEEYCRFMTSGETNLFVPKICFFDLRLGGLSNDPENADAVDLPYKGIEHLRNCLLQIDDRTTKKTKTADRIHPPWFPYRSIKNGAFLGNKERILYYPFPNKQELQTKHYQWWRSASL